MKINSNVRVAGISALAGTALLLTLWPSHRQTPKTEVEMPSSKLVRHDGRWFFPGGTNLFTGWLLETYPDGARQARSYVSNGALEGLSEGWYPNGQIQIREHFHNNASHGLRQKWYPNGTLMSEATVVQGDIHGTFQRWFENRQLAERIEIKNGKPDGLALAYYPNGYLQARTRTARGAILNQETWNDGERREPPADSQPSATPRPEVVLTGTKAE